LKIISSHSGELSVAMVNSEATTRDPYLELLKKCLTASLYDESAWRITDGFGKPGIWNAIRRAFYQLMRRRGYRLIKLKRFDADKRQEGLDWPMFGYSMVGLKRLDNLETCLRTLVKEQIPGDIIETGVWRGGACMFMKAVLNQLGDTTKNIWLADSFDGLPTPKAEIDKSNPGFDLAGCEFLQISLEQSNGLTCWTSVFASLKAGSATRCPQHRFNRFRCCVWTAICTIPPVMH
jgi:O-methyltransferase